MNKKLITAIAATTMAGAIGFASVAAAMEFNVYGSLRAGVYQKSVDDVDVIDTQNALLVDGNVISVIRPDAPMITIKKSAGRDALDFGTDKAGSRFGIKGSEDLGNGSSAGFHIERAISTSDTFSVRHQNVWLKGGWGKLTLGQQGNPYRNAANWDQSWWIGGNNRYGDGGSRTNGIRYDSNFGGPFSFSLMATADDADSAIDGWVVKVNDVNDADIHGANSSTITGSKISDEDGVDSFIGTAHFKISDVATVNIGFRTNEQAHNLPGESYDNSVISVNGAIGPFDWYVAYEENDDNVNRPAVTRTAGTVPATTNAIASVFAPQDAETVGVFLGLGLGESNYIYLEYEDSNVDGGGEVDGTNVGLLDKDALLLGYSYKIGPSTSFIVEYVSVDNESNFSADSDTFLAFFKVDF
ncbi:porin [Candidatus Spongiihabitans sp.]|uniref:porin n=1 Tax=Candidatus Spongiihabitans sp. TaxID=3101308 RepID=UPI003C6EFA01